MRSTKPSQCTFELFAALEGRQYLSNPTIVDFTVDTPEAYPGKVITLTAHATGTGGVRAVVFWIDNNDDALDQFIFNSFDQPLGEVRTPDTGTTDQFSLQVRVGASWQPYWLPDMRFGADAIDNSGNWTQQPIHFATINAKQKPFVQTMRAEPAAGGDIHLIATTSTDGERLTSVGIAGVTFFLDQNGNNQWDSSTDIDLGAGVMTSNGVYEKTVTPQGGWNLTWFAASAFDTRASADRFGPNHSAVLRGDAASPLISVMDIIPRDNDNTILSTSDETSRFYLQYTASATILGATFFLDRNQNGLWDAGIDTPLLQYFSGLPSTTGYADLFQSLGQLGHGWQSIGMAVHDSSGRGNDSWSAVTTAWINIDNTPWVANPVISPGPIPLGTATIDLTFDVHDDDGVQGITQSFIDINGNGGNADTGEAHGTNLIYLTPGRSNATWQLTFYVGNLPRGTYAIDIWLTDYADVRGPRTVVPFSIV